MEARAGVTDSLEALMIAECELISLQLDETLAVLEQMKHENLAFAGELRVFATARRRRKIEHALKSRPAGSTDRID
jgi:hypothetical protein